VRAGLASLGLRSLDELVGRADLLAQRDMQLAKTDGLDLSFVTTYAGETGASSTRRAQCAFSLSPFSFTFTFTFTFALSFVRACGTTSAHRGRTPLQHVAQSVPSLSWLACRDFTPL
jgi:hypothetical protein